MDKKDKKKLLEILGYKPEKKSKKTEKTASLKSFGKAVKSGAIGTAIGASIGLGKGYSKISENPNMSDSDKAKHSIMPTVVGATAGALAGGVALPKLKNGMSNVGKLFKTSEFLDELTIIKVAAMNVPDKEEINNANNVANDGDKIVESNGEPLSTDKTMDTDYTMQSQKEQKVDSADLELRR